MQFMYKKKALQQDGFKQSKDSIVLSYDSTISYNFGYMNIVKAYYSIFCLCHICHQMRSSFKEVILFSLNIKSLQQKLSCALVSCLYLALFTNVLNQ